MDSFEPKFKNLVQLYRQSVEAFTDRPLFGVKRDGAYTYMTYSEFGVQVDQARAGLAASGVEVGDRVAVIANNRPEWAVGAYATYGLGAAYVPMYEHQLEADWKYILNDCGAKFVLAANADIGSRLGAMRDELPDMQRIVVMDGEGEGLMSWSELLEKGQDSPIDPVEPEGEDIAGFIYTSGTTGNPKGVLLSHANLATNVSAIHACFPMLPEDRSLSFLPWTHSFGQVVELHGLLSMGASMGIAESVDTIIENLAEVRPTLLFSVPRIFNKIYDGVHKKMNAKGGITKKLFDAAVATAEKKKKLDAQGRSSGWVNWKHRKLDGLVFSKVRARFGGRLKYAFSGGAKLSKEVGEFIDLLGITIYEGYGLTETSPIATCNYPDNRKIGSVGKSIPGVHVEIDLTQTEPPDEGPHVEGEIVVYGHNVMQGYYNLGEANEAAFVEHDEHGRGFRTGDLGRLDDEGFVYITGRIKEQYKLENGKYVAPSPLEEKLKLAPYLANIMVYGFNRLYNVAILVPDWDMLTSWAEDEGLGALDRDALLKHEKTGALYTAQLAEYSSSFRGYEKCKKFMFANEDFSTENGMLTPTLKLKRRVVTKHYMDQIDALYA